MSGFSTSCSGGMPAEVFFSFCSPSLSDAPVGNGRGEDRDIGRQRGFHPVQHVARRFHRITVTPAGSRNSTGPETSVTSAPAARAAAAMAKPCLPEERLAI